MNVRSHNNGNGKRIVVSLSDIGAEHSLSESEATELRDALTRELGAPQALTPDEMMAWAAAFTRTLEAVDVGSQEQNLARAAQAACEAVQDLRDVNPLRLDLADRAMLAAMLGGGK